MITTKEQAMKMLEDGISPAMRARSQRFRTLLAKVLLESGPRPKTRRLPRAGLAHPELLGASISRTKVEKAARYFFESFFVRRFSAFEKLLATGSWVMWPEGEVTHSRKDALIQALTDRRGEAVLPRLFDVRSYRPAEFRRLMPAWTADAITKLIRGDRGLIVSARLSLDEWPRMRAMIMMYPNRAGEWIAGSLPLPGWDENAFLHKRFVAVDDDTIRLSSKVILHWHWRNGAQLQPLRNDITPRIMLDTKIELTEQVFNELDLARARPNTIDAVLTGIETIRFEKIDPHVQEGLRRRIQKSALDVWRQPIERLSPSFTVCSVGRVNQELEIEPWRKTALLFVETAEKDPSGAEVKRPRLAGIFAARTPSAPARR